MQAMQDAALVIILVPFSLVEWYFFKIHYLYAYTFEQILLSS